jgi:hypothetical protein
VRIKLTIVTLLSSLAFGAAAAAQDRAPAEPAPEATYDFADDVVEGAGRSPDGAAVRGLRLRDRESMVRLRAHFLPELSSSIDEI